MARIWSDENRFRTWLAVEVAPTTETLAAAGRSSQGRRESSSGSAAPYFNGRTHSRNRSRSPPRASSPLPPPSSRTGSSVPNRAGSTTASPSKRRIRRQPRSSAHQTASEVIEKDLAKRLSDVLERRAWEFKEPLPWSVRTHMASTLSPLPSDSKSPTGTRSETQRNIARFKAAAEDMRVGSFPGAGLIAAHLHAPGARRKTICLPASASIEARGEFRRQVIQRDRQRPLSPRTHRRDRRLRLDKIATEIRHLQRTEVREAEEFFSEKQKGSSAMPHKRNPVNAEQISGLARVVRSNAQAGLENVALWHERDISHSSAERVILPDSTTLTDYLLSKTANLIETMFVYPDRMRANLESTRGLIFSGQLLLDLVEHGVSREDAYRLVQSHAMRAWKENLNFRDEVLADREITGKVPRKQIEHSLQPRSPKLKKRR